MGNSLSPYEEIFIKICSLDAALPGKVAQNLSFYQDIYKWKKVLKNYEQYVEKVLRNRMEMRNFAVAFSNTKPT